MRNTVVVYLHGTEYETNLFFLQRLIIIFNHVFFLRRNRVGCVYGKPCFYLNFVLNYLNVYGMKHQWWIARDQVAVGSEVIGRRDGGVVE